MWMLSGSFNKEELSNLPDHKNMQIGDEVMEGNGMVKESGGIHSLKVRILSCGCHPVNAEQYAECEQELHI